MHLHVLCQVSGRREGLAARRAPRRPCRTSSHRAFCFLNAKRSPQHVHPIFLFGLPAPPLHRAREYAAYRGLSAARPLPSPHSRMPPPTPLISFTRPPGYHTPSYCTSNAAWYAVGLNHTSVSALSRQMSSRTSPSSKRTRQRGGSATGIRFTSRPRYHMPSVKRASIAATRPAGAACMAGLDGRLWPNRAGDISRPNRPDRRDSISWVDRCYLKNVFTRAVPRSFENRMGGPPRIRLCATSRFSGHSRIRDLFHLTPCASIEGVLSCAVGEVRQWAPNHAAQQATCRCGGVSCHVGAGVGIFPRIQSPWVCVAARVAFRGHVCNTPWARAARAGNVPVTA